MTYSFVDFIEIGTSDFDTEIQSNTGCGLSIEPVQFYLDRLPNRHNVKKLNIGISDINGSAKVYYTPTENIKKYNFPDWVRGCNCINEYHKTVVRLCKLHDLNVEDISDSYDVSIKTLFSVLVENNINGIYYLKIDTEGHDTVILKKFYEDVTHNNYLPHKILFESNTLTNKKEVYDIILLYEKKGYDLIECDHDTILQLNLTKIINKESFTDEIKDYYIMDYPVDYDPTHPPHENTLESAQNYCKEHNFSGVTYQYGRYEVRSGKYIHLCTQNNITSWLYI